MSGKNSQGKKSGRLDVEDMERRIVEFRLTLDREKRRCAQAHMMDKFEKLLREKLNEDIARQQTGSENSIKLDRLDTEGFNRLASFLTETINLCSQFEQHEQFQNVVRGVLQTARRKLVQMAAAMGQAHLEPFCLFCGTNSMDAHQDGCNGERAAISEHGHANPPLQAGERFQGAIGNSGRRTGNQICNSNGATEQQAYTPTYEASMAPGATATPPPSAAPTPDVLGQQQQQQQQPRQQDEHNSSLQSLRSQFNHSLLRNSSATNVPAPAGGSGTPPLSQNAMARLLLQQQQEARTAQTAAASLVALSTAAPASGSVPTATGAKAGNQQATARIGATGIQYQPQVTTASTNASVSSNKLPNISRNQATLAHANRLREQLASSTVASAQPFEPESEAETLVESENGHDSLRSVLDQLENDAVVLGGYDDDGGQRSSTPLAQPRQRPIDEDQSSTSVSADGMSSIKKLKIQAQPTLAPGNSIKMKLAEGSRQQSKLVALSKVEAADANRGAQASEQPLSRPVRMLASSPERPQQPPPHLRLGTPGAAVVQENGSRQQAGATAGAAFISAHHKPSSTASRIEEAVKRRGSRRKTTRRRNP